MKIAASRLLMMSSGVVMTWQWCAAAEEVVRYVVKEDIGPSPALDMMPSRLVRISSALLFLLFSVSSNARGIVFGPGISTT